MTKDVWSDFEPIFQSYCAPTAPASILVCKLDHVGDFCLAIDAFLTLRRGFPDSRITLACAPWNVAVARRLGIFDDVCGVQFFSSRAEDPLPTFDGSQLGSLRVTPFDVAIDLRVDPDTRVVLDHVTARHRFGYESDRNRMPLTVALPVPASSVNGDDVLQHQSLLMLAVAQRAVSVLGERHARGAFLRERLLPAAPTALLEDIPRPIAAICTGSGRRAKDWPLAYFAEVVRWLCETVGVSVVLVGSEPQRADAETLTAAIPSTRLFNLVGKTSLPEAIATVGSVDLFVGNDTGLTHYAAQFGVPTVAIFSGIDPTAVWAPIGDHVTIVKSSVSCSPCHILRLEDCSHDHVCMRNIQVQTVKRVIRRHLARTERILATSAPDPSPATPASLHSDA